MARYEFGRYGYTGSTHARDTSERSKTLCGRKPKDGKPWVSAGPRVRAGCKRCQGTIDGRRERATSAVTRALHVSVGTHVERWESCNLTDPMKFRDSASDKLLDADRIRSWHVEEADWLTLWKWFRELSDEDDAADITVGARVQSWSLGYTAVVTADRRRGTWMVQTDRGQDLEADGDDLWVVE